jgi:hypothetical protein
MTTLPYLNLASCIRSLSIYLFWKGGILCTCLASSFYKYGLLVMIHVTCGPLDGVLVFICRTLPGKIFSMEEQGHLDLHKGLNPIGWMMHPTPFKLWKMNVAIGGT